jgi:hypothetical protein
MPTPEAAPVEPQTPPAALPNEPAQVAAVSTPAPAPSVPFVISPAQNAELERWNLLDKPETVRLLTPMLSDPVSANSWHQDKIGGWYNNQRAFEGGMIGWISETEKIDRFQATEKYRNMNQACINETGMSLYELAKEFATKRQDLFLTTEDKQKLKDDAVKAFDEHVAKQKEEGFVDSKEYQTELTALRREIETLNKRFKDGPNGTIPSVAERPEWLEQARLAKEESRLEIEDPIVAARTQQPPAAAPVEPVPAPTLPLPPADQAPAETAPVTTPPVQAETVPAPVVAVDKASVVKCPELERLGIPIEEGKASYTDLASGLDKALSMPTRENIDSMFAVINGKTKEEIDGIAAAYKEKTSRNLEDDIKSKVPTTEEARTDALSRLDGFNATKHGDSIYLAVNGVGTYEMRVQRAMVGLSVEQMKNIDEAISNEGYGVYQTDESTGARYGALLSLVHGDMNPDEIRSRMKGATGQYWSGADTKPIPGVDISRYIYPTNVEEAAKLFRDGIKEGDWQKIRAISENPNFNAEEKQLFVAAADNRLDGFEGISTGVRKFVMDKYQGKAREDMLAILDSMSATVN